LVADDGIRDFDLSLGLVYVYKRQIYNLQGILIKEGCRRNDLKKLPTGAYILCQGNVRKKIMIR
ncbi:MAG: hypothetical protein K2I99_03410, partial [Bacteroidaceae bacterium]|nr:hypothetical protein [Bacteroidaceae bacterium]